MNFSEAIMYERLIKLLEQHEFNFGRKDWSTFIDWAIAALEAGMDTPALCTLAGLYGSSDSEIENYFVRTVHELGWTLPNEEQCLLGFARKTARSMLAGEIGLSDGCHALYLIHIRRQVKVDLSCFDYYNDEFSQAVGKLPNQEELERDVREAAKSLLDE